MKKEIFVKLINATKTQHELDCKCHKSMQEFFIDFEGWYNNSILAIAIEETLAEEMGDLADHWISYFMWELDFGSSYSEGDVTEADGTSIDLSTAFICDESSNFIGMNSTGLKWNKLINDLQMGGAGDYIEITGTVEDYEGEKEVIANRIRII